jgi:hypothetical protein
MSNPKQRILISLVGGRPLPNVLIALHLNPAKIYFIVSQDSLDKVYPQITGALPESYPYENRVVDPYQVSDSRQKCQDIVQMHQEDEIIFDITAGTKPMAFGVYDCAREKKEQGLSVDISYLNREQLQSIFDSTRLDSVTLSIQDYFKSYGWNINLNQDDKQLKQVSSIFQENLDTVHELLRKLKAENRGKGKRKIGIRHSENILSDKEINVLNLIPPSIISNITKNSFTINGTQEGELIINGKWLEYLVYDIAQESKLFDECAWGVEDTNRRGEIDFVGIKNGQLIIASCKTDQNLERRYFEEYHSKSVGLGNKMCSVLLITTISRESRDAKTLAKYESWSKEREVTLIMREDVARLVEIFKKIVNNKEGIPGLEHIQIYSRI